MLSHSSPSHFKTISIKWMAATPVIAFGGHLAFINSGTNYCSQSLIFAAISLLAVFIALLLFQNLHIPSIEQKIGHVLRSWPYLCHFFLFGIIFHAISYASSSFIEEEHQTWYYLTSTALIALYLMETRAMMNGKKASERTAGNRQFLWISLFVAHLIARRLNQTGDKWLMQPDIGDWLTMEEHRFWNSIFVFASICCTFLNCVDFGSILTNVLTLTACTLVYYFRTIGGFVDFPGIQKSE